MKPSCLFLRARNLHFSPRCQGKNKLASKQLGFLVQWRRRLFQPASHPDQLAQERNDNAKTIKMDGAIRSGANSEFEILCSSHSIADVRSGFCRFEVGGNSAGVSILAGL